MEAPDLLDFNHSTQKWHGLLEEYRQNYQRLGIRLSHVIVEVNAAQRFLLQYDHARRWQSAHGIAFVSHTTTMKKLDPELGVPGLLPSAYRFGRKRLPGGSDAARRKVKPLIDQLIRWPDTSVEDQVMADWFGEARLSHVISMSVEQPKPQWRPSWLVGGRK